MGDVLGSNVSVNYKISLDDLSETYRPGDVISGTFMIETTQVLQFKAINITYCGEASVHWEEWKTRRSPDYTHFGQEHYFNFTECVRGGRDLTTLPPGNHSIPFQHVLPEAIPSSFYSEYGCVSYYIKASVEYGDQRADGHLEKEFNVVAPLDLNTKEYVQHPIFLEFEEVYGFCIPSVLNVQVCLPQSGYCPGQSIPMHVNVDNGTNVKIKKILFQLIRKEYYRCHDSGSSFSPPEQVLATMKTNHIASHSRRDFTVDLLVPGIVASVAPNLCDCRIIDVAFYLRVTMKLSGFNDDLTNQAELCIGSIPLSNLPPYPHSLLYHPIYLNSNEFNAPPPPYSSVESGYIPEWEQSTSPAMNPAYQNVPMLYPYLPTIRNATHMAPSAPPWGN